MQAKSMFSFVSSARRERPLRFHPQLAFCWLIGCLAAAGSVFAQTPAAPSELKGRVLLSSCIELTWRGNAENETGYEVERKHGDGPWVLVARLPANQVRFESGGLRGEPGNRYEHRVRAVGANSASDWVHLGPISTPAPEPRAAGRIIIAGTKQEPRHGTGSFFITKEGKLAHLDSVHVGGTGDEHASHIDRYISRDGGRSWHRARTEFYDPNLMFWQGSITTLRNGNFLASFSVYPRNAGINRFIKDKYRFYTISRDGGQTWSEYQKFPAGTSGLAGSQYVLSNGRVITPLHQMIQEQPQLFGVLVMYSDDDGSTWQAANGGRALRNPDPKLELEESSIVEWQPGKLLMHIRVDGTGWIWESRSEDYGTTWSDARPAMRGVLNSVLTKIPGSRTIAAFFHPHVASLEPDQSRSPGKRGQNRIILAAQLSSDGGHTWYGYKEIDYDGTSWQDYPSVLWIGDTLHLAWRWYPKGMSRGFNDPYRHVRYLSMDKKWLLGPPARWRER